MHKYNFWVLYKSKFIQIPHSSVAQVLRLGLLESRDRVQEACEVWGELPQTSHDWSDIPREEEATYEDWVDSACSQADCMKSEGFSHFLTENLVATDSQ